MTRPSKWGETDYAAQLAGMTGGDGYERTFETAILRPSPEAELVERREGPALKAPLGVEAHSETDGLLEGFARLVDAPDEAIVEYARTYGPLQLCAHGLPYQHRPQPYPQPDNSFAPATVDKLVERGIARPSELLRSGQVVTWCRPTEVEPLERWRHFSRQVRALLAIGAKVNRAKVGRPADWQAVYADLDREAPWWEQGVDIDRIQLAQVIDEWFRMTGARPVMRWGSDEDRPTLSIAAQGLFQNLARELALTVARLDGLAVCDGCGSPYIPERKPRADRRSFCQACREAGVPARLRKRAQRERDELEQGDTDG